VLNLDVDINVADLGCLAGPPGHQEGRRVQAGPRLVRRGDRGKPVERLTRRLSYVRSPSSRSPYLDGPRRRFDGHVERALRAFQREHRLDVDGVYGPATARALARAGQHQRSGGSNGKPPARPAKLRTLVEELRRLDAEADRAWERVVAYAESRRRLLAQTAERDEDGRALSEIVGILGDMRHTLDRIAAAEERELALEEREAGVQYTEAKAEAAQSTAEAAQTTAEAAKSAPSATATATDGGNGAGATSAVTQPPAGAELVLHDLSDEELHERLDRLERARDRSRAVLLRRYLEVEKKLAVVAPRRQREPRALPQQPPRGGRRKPPAEDRDRRPAEDRGRRRIRRRITGPARKTEQESAEHVRALQEAMNRFTGKYLEGVGPVLVDGVKGPATNKRIRRIKYYLGYKGPEQRNVSADPDFLRRMAHARSGRASSPAMLTRGIARRRKQHKAAKAAARPRAGVASFDGIPVAAWMVPYLEWARTHGWQGRLNSGYRTPEYSEHLCMGICGAPSCPGRCAGRSSNHVGRVKPQGSIDVSDYVRFGELMRRCPYSPRILNDLPADRVHYSSTGH
jgi:peptidoglycan hydrolase-like protein with peptidoglycan-binding domain